MTNNRLKILFLFLLIPMLFFSQTKKKARWSIMPEYGYLVFDGDINQHLRGLFPTSLTNQVNGLNVAYSFDPIWGMAIDGYFFPVRAINKSPLELYISTNVYNGDLMGTVNLSKLIFPNTKAKLQLLTGVGLGFAYYKYDVRHYPSGIEVPDNETYTDIKYNGQLRPVKINDGKGAMDYGLAVSAPFFAALEYNFSKSFSIGGKVDYRAYNKDNLEGVTYLNWNGVTNDYIGFASIYFRYKIGAVSRNHVRNMTMKEYKPDETMEHINQLKQELAGLKNRVDTVENKVNNMLPRLEKLETMIKNEGPDSDNDGVIDIRDKDPNTPPNTPVDFYGKTLIIPATTTNSKNNFGSSDYSMAFESIPTVYFDFDQFKLDDEALITISKIAERMLKDKSLLLEVRGFTDYLGDVNYNEKLSMKRAERVKTELVKVWGIEDGRIIANPKGKVIHPQIKYRPNRRCEFYFSNDIVDILND